MANPMAAHQNGGTPACCDHETENESRCRPCLCCIRRAGRCHSGSGLPAYVAVIKPVTAERLGSSWRAGCPVGPGRLRLVNLSFVGFDGAVHRGELVVNADRATEVAHVFADLYFGRFPIERMETVEK
ncbi:hypothetical protein ABJI51_37630 [Amycolatopsis sp. NEAU-NG30]|uniref:Uncharacterized protein n=1 Tax=Amycolatopsis melonis TaxID=3156488 RepID=A0ABV0LU02_9PSEU